MFEDMFQNGFSPLGLDNSFSPNAMMGGIEQGNFMNFGTEIGHPSWTQQLGTNLNKAGNTFAQNQPMFNFAFQGAKGLFDTYNAFKQNSMQKDLLNFQKQAYRTNLDMTKKTTNMELSDRQRRRVSANPNAESVENYMKKWGV